MAFQNWTKEFVEKIANYFDQPLSREDILDLLVGKKSEEEIKNSLEKNRWPFNLSEKEMKKTILKLIY